MKKYGFMALVALAGCTSTPVAKQATQTVLATPGVRLVTLSNTNQNYVVVRSTNLVNGFTTIYTGTNGAPVIEVWDTSGAMDAFYDVRPH